MLTKAEKSKRYRQRLKSARPDEYQHYLEYISNWKKENPELHKKYQKKYRSTEHYKQLKKEQNKRYYERVKAKKEVRI